MSLAALGGLLLQVAAQTPTPDPTPTPTPRSVAAAPRTLQDLARERRLSADPKGKGSLVTIVVGPSTAGAAPATTSPAPKGAPEAAAAAEATPPAEPLSNASVRIVSVSNDGIVDGSGGVRVTGSLRNAGDRPVCSVVITLRILDSRGQYLASGQASPDVGLLAPGEITSFHAVVQAPPGVRGARTNPDRKDVTDGSTSMAGDWKLLGGTEASIASASENCPK